jgi:hypothetical protein
MRSIEELKAEEARVRAILSGGAEAQLRAIPGVVHVSVGLKQINGTATDEFSIRVYVTEKKDPNSIPPNERIPKSIQGVPTDVNQVRVNTPHFDTARYRPITGGIQITNGVDGFGTLGCLVTDDTDGKPLLLSNFHVLGGNPASSVFQPNNNPGDQVGTVKRALLDGVIDASVAEIAVGTATTTDEIKGLAVGGSDHVSGSTFPLAGMHVFKVGINTGRTEGKVVDPDAATSFDYGPPLGIVPMEHAMLVQCTKISTCCCCSCTVVDSHANFSDHGDSGAAILDDQRRVIGLVVGGSPGETFGCRFTEIQTRLRISVNATPAAPHVIAAVGGGAPVPPAVVGAGAPFAVRAAVAGAPPSAEDESVWAAMQRRLDETPFGHEIGVQVRIHLPEAIDLVNHHRAVMVTWQRVQGPSFLAQWMNGVRNPSQPVPREINGVAIDGALLKLAAVLKAHGSAQLRQSIDTYGLDLLSLLDRSTTVDELIENLGKPIAV